MDYQKITLVGEITNKPTITKLKYDNSCDANFELTVKYLDGGKVVFPVLYSCFPGENIDQEIIKGREILIEGSVDLKKNGKFRVIAQDLRIGCMVSTSVKDSKLLF